MPRALILCEHATLNGGERSLLAVLPRLRQVGWVCDFLAPQEGALADALRGQQWEIVSKPAWRPPAAVREDDRDEQIAATLKARRYDLVHANSLAMSIRTGMMLQDLGVPTIGHLRDIAKLSGPKIAALGRHTRLLAVSAAVKAAYVSQGLDTEKVHVLHNGVDLKVFLPSPLAGEGPGVRGLPAELGLPPQARFIGMIGQIILRKGQDTALAAAASLMRKDANLHIVVVGARHSAKQETIDYECRLQAIAAAAGIAEQVHFLGTRDDVPQLLPQLSLLLHTARQEPLGRVLLEAAACGVPVVATDVGGTREIFPREADDGALLIPVDDVAETTTACRRVLDDPAFARQLGVAGRRRIEEAFSVETAAAGLLRHYREVSGIG